MRTKKSLLNIGSNFFIMLSKSILAFILRTIFIKILGEDYLGVNGLLTNVLSMLSLAELGVSAAINFSLYKPLAENDNERISTLMSFYRKAYSIIGAVVFVLGIVLMFFLKYIIKDYESIQNLNIIYLLYLLNTVSTYFISYKETLITADQKNYKLTKINFISILVLYLLQIILLVVTRNYIVYLVTQYLVTLIQRVATNIYISKEYSYISFKSKEKLNPEDKNTIITNIKAMFLHKIGDYCINGTDNIIISSFISIGLVGIYSNYVNLITILTSFISVIYGGVTASIGNLIATENEEKRIGVFKKLNFVGFIIYGLCSVCFLNLFNPFIELWIGQKYLLSFGTVVLIVLNFYITGARVPITTMKSAAGLYKQDRYTPLLQSLINLVISIALVKPLGIAGVLLGTLISSIAIPLWQRPYIIYKYIFKKSSKEYFILFFKYLFTILFISIITYFACEVVTFSIPTINLIVKFLLCIAVYIVVIYILYRNTEEYNYILSLIKKGFKKALKRGVN